MSTATGYRLSSHGDMITDRPRMDAYAEALRRAVRPGCVVLDVGAGTGIFSLIACQLGAAHVFAVEPDDIVHVARDIAAANGFSDRITFFQALSTEVKLPSSVDVVVSDLRGILPLLQNHIPSIVDARRRLQGPGGTLIPRRDTLWAALVEDAELYRPYDEPWRVNHYGVDMSAGQPLVVNSWRKAHVRPDRLLGSPLRWATLDYATIDSPNVEAELSCKAERPGTAHGLLLWFDAELTEDIGFSNAPGEPPLIYGQAFFPLQEPVPLEPGEEVSVRLAANLVGGEYVWRWATTVFPATGPGGPRVRFQQSTFFGSPIDIRALRRKEAGYSPRLSEDGEIDRFTLERIDGRTALRDIASELVKRFPVAFVRWEDAVARAARVAEKYAPERAAPWDPAASG